MNAGTYYIIFGGPHRRDKTYIDLPTEADWNNPEGGAVQKYNPTARYNQKWEFLPAKGNYAANSFLIRCYVGEGQHKHICLASGVLDGQFLRFSNWSCSIWQIEEQPDGTNFIRDTQYGPVIDYAPELDKEIKTNLFASGIPDNHSWQRWRLEPV